MNKQTFILLVLPFLVLTIKYQTAITHTAASHTLTDAQTVARKQLQDQFAAANYPPLSEIVDLYSKLKGTDINKIINPPVPQRIQTRRQPVILPNDFIVYTGERYYQMIIRFSKPFNQIPTVYTAFSLLNLGTSKPIKIQVNSKNVTKEGFILVTSSWSYTECYSIIASWIAYGN